MKISGDGLTKQKVLNAWESKIFSESDINRLKNKVKTYNQEIDGEILKVIEQRQALVDIRQRLLQQKDKVKLVAQLKEAEKSYNQIVEDIKKNLENISYKGFYVCVIKDIDPFADPEKLIDQARQYITPDAVEDILGSFITSVTELYKQDGFDDKIYKYAKEEISGKFEVESKYGHKANPAEQVFWYACKVNVAPLKDKPTTQVVSQGNGNSRITVINVLKDSDYKNSLSRKGVSQETISEIAAAVDPNKTAVLAENRSIKSRERNYITSGQQKLDELTAKIQLLNQRIEDSHATLKRLIENNTSIKYNRFNVEKSLNDANTQMVDKINKLVDEELAWKGKKLQAEWDRTIATPGNPKEAISRNVVELKGQFETNYGKIDQFIEINELENDDFTKSQGRTVTYNRKVDHLWIYTEALSSGYKLHVVVDFRITGKQGGGSNVISGSTKGNFTESTANLNMEMVYVKGGTFQMGSTNGDDDEKPVHTVTVSDFYMGKYEVTHAQYIVFLNSKGVNSNGSYGGEEYIDMDDSDCAIGHNDSRFYFKGSSRANSEKCPVIEVTWYGAKAFAEWLSSKSGKKYRLPTESEWEYAARGGIKSKGYTYAGSNNIDEVAEYDGNNNSKTKPVGGKIPNELGLYDMSGNVYEWCEDWKGSYSSSSQTNPKGPLSGSNRVLRGGSWYSNAENCRIAYRSNSSPDDSYFDNGFRLVLIPD